MPYRYKCVSCNEWHEGFPDIAADRPLPATEIGPQDVGDRLRLSSDLCSIDGKSFFVRCLIFVPIIGTDDSFGFNIWSSLSETNFRRYEENYDADMSDWEPMFGYLSNELPGYAGSFAQKLSVQTMGIGMRPIATVEPTDHPLSVDQRHGMPLQLAIELASPYLHVT